MLSATVAFGLAAIGLAASSTAVAAPTNTLAMASFPAMRGDWERIGADCPIGQIVGLSANHPDVNQFIMVVPRDFEATDAALWVASRRNGLWRCDSSPVTAQLGRSGTRPLLERRSGDGTTPAGVFELGRQTAWDGQEFSFFGNRADPGQLRAEYRKVLPQDCWGATPQDPDYQRLVNREGCPGPDDEWLQRYGDVYSHAAVIGANMGPEVSGDAPGEPAYAAAIFLHRNSYTPAGDAKPTSGCVSIAYEPLVETLQLIDPELNPRFAIGPISWLANQ